MAAAESFFPLEFIVTGVPASQQATKSKSKWMDRVRSAAKARMDEQVAWTWLEDRPLAVTIFYFASYPMQGDIDNIVKPILDALSTVAFLDDSSIEKVTVQKFEPNLGWSFAEPGPVLSGALDTSIPFTYIRLDDTLAWRRL